MTHRRKRHPGQKVPYVSIDPEPEFLREPYEAYQHRAAAAALKEGPTMTTTPARDLSATPLPPAAPGEDAALRQEVSRLAEIVDQLMPGVLMDYRAEVDSLRTEVTELRDQVTELKARPKKATAVWQPDALDWQLIEILRHVYPMAVDAPALVSAGLACAETTALTRADILAERGMIEREYRNADGSPKARSRRRFRALPEKS